MSGSTPEGRPELAELAASIADVRAVAHGSTAPQPSAALSARLAQPSLGVSVGSAPESRRGITKMVTSFAGLGLATKLAAATAVLALGLTGVGAAGALPGPAQDAFDGVVGTFVSTEDEVVDDGAIDECVVDVGTEECADVSPVGSKEFSDWVVRGAQDPDKVGSEFGRAVSEQARELRFEKAAERAENGGSNGSSNGNGKPADKPAGRP